MSEDSLPSPKRLFIAEDNPLDLHLLRTSLLEWGYQAVTATDGEAAWRLLQKDHAPRLVILDWMMPGMTGLEICRAVRRREGKPYVYLLMLTAKTEKAEIIRAFDAGADDCLSKPFLPGELHARLRVGERILSLQDNLLSSQQALRFEADHDPLTGLWNRAAILRILDRELSRAARQSAPVVVVFADIDHFKRLNDTYGHAAGDAALRAVALRMQQTVRIYDSVGRFGGEEFLIVLPACDIMGACRQAERLRQWIAASPVELPGAAVRITLSLGLASTGGEPPVGADELLRVADAALYRAKRKGRNRVESEHSRPVLSSVRRRRCPRGAAASVPAPASVVGGEGVTHEPKSPCRR